MAGIVPKGSKPEWIEVEYLFKDRDRAFAQAQVNEESTYEFFEDNCRRCTHGCRVERAALRHMSDQIDQRLQEVMRRDSQAIHAERVLRHETETRLERLADEKVAETRGVLAEEMKLVEEAEQYTNDMSNEVCHLYNDIEKAKDYRLEKADKLQEAVNYKFEEIRVAIAAEQRIRKESEFTLLELFGQMGTKMEQELIEVRNERKLFEDRLYKLMEVVLPNLEIARARTIRNMDENKREQESTKKMACDATEKYNKRQTLLARRTTVKKSMAASSSLAAAFAESHGQLER